MKLLLTLVLLFCGLSGARAATTADCAKSTDACAASPKKLSPFLAASAAAPALPKETVKEKALTANPAPAPAAMPVPTAPAPAPVAPAPSRRGTSSPLWLLFVGGSVAGLYFYLGAGERKRKRK
jgi:hypothetical protein